MHPAVRVGYVVMGAAMAVYGAASLTGGWLGIRSWDTAEIGIDYHDGRGLVPHPTPIVIEDAPRGPGWVLVVSGLVNVAVGAWPQRRGAAS